MKKRVEKENSERWLLTYSDLITLLMIFFVIMYALSNVDVKKYAALSNSLKIAMGSSGGKNIIGQDTLSDVTNKPKPVDNTPVPDDSAAADKAEQTKLENIKKQVDAYLQKNGMSGSVGTDIQARGLVISIKDTLLFDSGSADLNPTAVSKLMEIGKMLSTIDNFIVVEGNTDNVPISTYQFKDNWDLAASRADNVTRVLLQNSGIQPDRIASRSNGQYRPVASNATEEGRAQNRRVDIIILDSKYNTTESNKSN